MVLVVNQTDIKEFCEEYNLEYIAAYDKALCIEYDTDNGCIGVWHSYGSGSVIEGYVGIECELYLSKKSVDYE